MSPKQDWAEGESVGEEVRVTPSSLLRTKGPRKGPTLTVLWTCLLCPHGF